MKLAPSADARCPKCAAPCDPGLLACPSCHALVHAAELSAFAAEAERATAAGDVGGALLAWREARALLPEGTRQREAVDGRIRALTAAGAAPPPKPRKSMGPLATVGALGLVLLSKAKFLLLGLTKLSTLLSMLASVGLYWTIYGWRFALGLVLSIYVHEMGHVAALRRVGLPASAPMFIPGFGAFVRLRERPSSPTEDAFIGLAGPWWGLGAAFATWGLFLGTHSPVLAAIAQTGAWVNLFNLTPVSSLDGSRGFAALSRPFRGVVVAAAAAGWWATDVGMLGLVALVGTYRVVTTPAPQKGDARTLVSFLALLALLGWLAAVPVAAAGR